MFKNKKIYVAPMMQYTDRHDRYFLRLISKNVILFTEMIPSNAIIYGNKIEKIEKNVKSFPKFDDGDDLHRRVLILFCIYYTNQHISSEIHFPNGNLGKYFIFFLFSQIVQSNW